MTCHVPGCDADMRCRLPDGEPVCATHYGRWRRTGDVQADVPVTPKAPPNPTRCKGCGAKTRRRALNWCSTACRLSHETGRHIGPRLTIAPGHEPVGSLRVACGVVFVKVAVGLWRPRAAVVWELVHGRDVPLSYVVEHVDGDRLNDDPGNLRIVRVPRVVV